MVMMMAPVPTTGPIIPVVPGAHDHRRGVHDGWRGRDEHGCGGDDDRKPDADGDMHPRVGGERQSKRGYA
jgi:hypothetical protein